MDRFVCIHGHFYQPPRENPWLEEIEIQDTAHPYHDWNERVSAECYSQNGASRVLDEQGNISEIVNNYSRISFNFGPTLLSWLELRDPDTYHAVLEADKESQARFSGHGSALAQGYNHIILPLANERDKETQVVWGLADFRHRFKRDAEGMWLPETAADVATLEALARQDVKFTVLSPYQAKRIRKIGAADWNDVSGGRVDPSMPYLCRLPSGRQIALYFYDGPTARAVAFERLLADGANYARRIVSGFNDQRDHPQLMHIATDGESYGHHHRFGDMALAFALDYVERNKLARITNYGEFLEKFPPTYEAEIIDNTSWSCAHGVERWRANCGCNTGGNAGWNQEWRRPLREALDWLRDELATLYEREGGRLFKDPWQARNEYISVILNRSQEHVAEFLDSHGLLQTTPDDQMRQLKLLGIQRHALLMFTSCGWFFDDLAGIETIQILQYAGRAIQLTQELFSDSLEERFLQRLAKARSNQPGNPTGADLYQTRIKPAMLDLVKVGAHYAVASLFIDFPPVAHIYSYLVEQGSHEAEVSGRTKLCMGEGIIQSLISLDKDRIGYVALHFGDHNVAAGVKPLAPGEYHRQMCDEMRVAYLRADLTEVIRLIDRHFGTNTFTLRSLFRDERKRILERILEGSTNEADLAYLEVFSENAPVMRFLADQGLPIPRAFLIAVERAVNHQLEQVFKFEYRELPREASDSGNGGIMTGNGWRMPMDIALVERLLGEATLWQVKLDDVVLGHTLRRSLDALAEQFAENYNDIKLLNFVTLVIDLVRRLPFEASLWRTQNVYYRLATTVLPDVKRERSTEEPHRRRETDEWVSRFEQLGGLLKVRVPQ